MLRPTARMPRASLLLPAFALALATALAPPANATDHSWINPAGGFSYDAANWTNGSGPSVPGPLDVARFDLVNNYTVNWAFPIDSLAWIDSHAGHYRFNINGRLGVRFQSNFNPDSVTFLSGTFSTGTMNVSYTGSTTKMLASGYPTIVLMTDSTAASFWSSQYQSWVTATRGASIRCNGYLILSSDSGGRCSTTVTSRDPTSLVFSKLSTLSSLDPLFGDRGDIIVGERGNAVLQAVFGGLVESAGDLYIARGTSSTSMVHVFNPSPSVFFPALTVHGNAYVGTNSLTFSPFGAGNGTLFLEKGFNTIQGLCRVGGRGTGQLTVRNTAGLSTGGLWVGPDSSGHPAQFALRGSVLATIGNTLAIAGDSAKKSGLPNASASVDSGATLNYTGASPLRIWGNTGLLEIKNASQVTSAARVTVGGTLSLLNSTLTAPVTQITGTGLITGTGAVNARMICSATGTVETAPSGGNSRLSVGDSTATDGFSGLATLNAYGDTLEIRDLDGADVGSINLGSSGNDGTFLMRSGARMLVGRELYGYGNIVGNFVNEGALHPVVSGLNFYGHLTHLTGSVTAGSTTVRIFAGGALTARGAMGLSSLNMYGAMDLGPTPAKLSLAGSLILTTTSSTRIRLGSRASGIWDTVAVAGPALLDGVLDLRAIPGNEPVVGDTLLIATLGSRTNTFSSVTINGVPAAGWLTVLYGPTTVKVVITKAVVSVSDDDASAAPRAVRFFGAGTLAAPAFALDLPEAASVRVVVYDVSGRELAVVAEGALPAGRHQFALRRDRFANGMRFARAVIKGSSGERILTARALQVR